MPADPRSLAQVRRDRLLELLADGAFHSGEHLAKRLRISRGGIWKVIRGLRAIDIEVQSVPRQGYRLPRAVDLYDRDTLLQSMSEPTRALLDRLDVMLTVDSTNAFITQHPVSVPGHANVCVAEIQTAGRGRRGRSWVAPFGSGICLSLGWQFAEQPPTFSALSLAVGVAVVRTLRRLGMQQVGLKWPNDIVWQQRKLGGILIEMRGESAGPAHVVIGIGLNMRMPASVRIALAEQQAALIADVHEVLRDKTPNRNVLAGALIDELADVLRQFASQGFEPFAAEWRSLDALADAPVKVLTSTNTTLGTARGVDADGTLLVDVNGELRRFVSGEVSLRARSS